VEEFRDDGELDLVHHNERGGLTSATPAPYDKLPATQGSLRTTAYVDEGYGGGSQLHHHSTAANFFANGSDGQSDG
jgi:hypothetical protein